ncbi:hypothetical protein PN36_17295 [Candidatus Thiomargarita nelsonii]|uniref:Uncharacterized protein n=1 Tax=Candidatus Thiomargarita nelsonii TaxID=1003181 RepID=A0A4E0QPH5_9GAMM|nr:hypothetical protein PN36_17295 [Candidatus Thiomargarita nelsonii]
MVLPTAWKERLGELDSRVELKTATQSTVVGEICGPVQIQIEGFRPIYNEVLFLVPTRARQRNACGYIVLEQAQIAVDMVGHRLIYE